MRTLGELRAALASGWGYPGDLENLEAEVARELSRSSFTDLSAVSNVIAEFRGRVFAKADPAVEPAVAAALAEIEEFRAHQAGAR